MADAFDRIQGTDSTKGDAFDRFPVEEESFGKSAARYATQIPQGIAATTTPGLAASFFQLLAAGETDLPVEEWQRLRKLGEESGIPWDDEAYESARQDVLGSIPTVSNIARKVEEKTGIPLETKTEGQKALRFFTEASRLAPGKSAETPQGWAFRGTNTGLPRPVLGAGITGAREGLLQAGVPEPIADIASFLVVKPTAEGAGRFDIGAAKKDSGLTTRKYESLEKPRDVSAGKITKIKDEVEKEFRDLTDKIIKETPISETYSNLRENPQYKQLTRDSFKELETLTESIPGTVSTKDLVKEINTVSQGKTKQGFLPSEYEKTHNKFLKEMIKETPTTNVSASDFLAQFRKNNKSYGEIKEPGQSYAYNQAKRDALRDYNIGIENLIENKYKGTEFPKVFKELNDRWSKIMDAETIFEFLDDTFKGKVDFKNARDLFEKNGMSAPFERAMGKEGFSKFETLVNDLLSTEKGMKLLKTAEQKGYGDLVHNAGAYILHPKVTKAKLGMGYLKDGYNAIFNLLLDKPKLAVTWDRGINAMKRGDFKAAQKELGAVKSADEAFRASEAKRVETLKKFNEKRKAKEIKPKDNPVQRYEELGDDLKKLRKDKGSKESIDKIMQEREKLLENDEVLDSLLSKNEKPAVTKKRIRSKT